MSVSKFDRIRRKQILREAEGYLELIMVLADQWSPRPEVRDRLAQRTLETLERLEALGGFRGELCHMRGQALRAMERYAAALVPLAEASECDPGNINIWLALGWCYKRTGRLDMAIQSLEEALSVAENEAIIYYNLACYWSLAGNTRLALDYLGEALEIDPNYRDLVADEKDFDPIRNHPDFQALTSVIV